MSAQTYQQWLRSYKTVIAADASLLRLDPGTFRSAFEAAYTESTAIVEQEVAQLLRRKNQLDARELMWLFAYIRQCEDTVLAQREASFDIWKHPRCRWRGKDYVALDMPKVLFRNALSQPPTDALRGIPASAESQASSTRLYMRFLWCETNSSLSFSFDTLEELTWTLPEDGLIRIGVASWVNESEVSFDCNIPYPGVVNGVWARCHGPRPSAAMTSRMCEIVRSAIQASINVLIFPELTMDPDLVETLSRLLDSIEEDHALHLIVAGSMHATTSEHGYANRSCAISGMGQLLWSQDKLAEFDIVKNGQHYFEPRTLGGSFEVRESETLGRVAIVICSDFCNRDKSGRPTALWSLLQQSRCSLILVPSMQDDGNLERFATSAKVLRDAHWASTVVSNIRVHNRTNNVFENSSFVWLADSRDRSAPPRIQAHSKDCLEIFLLRPITSQGLVKYKASRLR